MGEVRRGRLGLSWGTAPATAVGRKTREKNRVSDLVLF
jgi:hypothetical protein